MTNLTAAEHLKKLRAQRGWSQRDLADRAGIAQPVLSRYESGVSEPRFSTLLRILEIGGYELIVLLAPVTGEQCAAGEFDDLTDAEIGARVGRPAEDVRIWFAHFGGQLGMMSTQQAGEPVRVAYGRPPRARTRGRDEVAISPSAVRSAQAMIHAGRDLAGALNPLAVDEGLAAPLSGHELDEVSEAIAVVRDKLNRTEKFIAELRTRPSF
ncbi:helix-turn-helix domain-containing protein [Rhodococcus sp. (in: high G+C Gram-positive bacteria)]|uniref:helix-turn-helix domain-containing protein n=1 Tax=Rhodococcus sp. TaxID=1831 RepID=UPI00257C03AF|nr:helix-turn-helix domain-containing protein [Rhodococcus sp. (in: high G+C Gram-positive bacteria)]MBQ9056467.1 helix-turn-helix domain-containing protein [Rhodococcus sp. (in: high G+C Gram-positive bacteria)]